MRDARQIAGRVAGSYAAVFIVTIAVRLAVFSLLLPVQGAERFYSYNEQARLAWAMVSGYGFSSPWVGTPLLPSAQQPPLYPWFLAGVFKIAGPYSYGSLCIAEFFNVACAALTGVLILKIGKQVFGPLVGVLAGWAWACWIYESAVCMRLWDSSLSALLLSVAVWWLLYLNARSPWMHWASFGTFAGISALSNTTLLSVFAGFWLWLWVRDRKTPGVGKLLVSVLFCILTLLPWTVRNYVEFNRLLPIRDNFGFELWQGNHEGPAEVVSKFDPEGEIGFMEARGKAAVQFIRESPQRFLRRCAYRFFRFWTDPSVVVWLPVSALAWLGCAFAVRSKGHAAIPFMIAMLMFPAVYYVTHPGAAYRHPLEPVILLCGAYAAVSLVEKVRLRPVAC